MSLLQMVQEAQDALQLYKNPASQVQECKNQLNDVLVAAGMPSIQ